MNSGSGGSSSGSGTSKIEKNVFNFDEESYLINFVKENPVLYMINHIDFRKNTLKNSLWAQLSKQLGKTPAQCKKRWKTIRDTYGKLSRNAPKRTRWVHFEAMYFMEINEQKVSRPIMPSDVSTLVPQTGASSVGQDDEDEHLHQPEEINNTLQKGDDKKYDSSTNFRPFVNYFDK